MHEAPEVPAAEGLGEAVVRLDLAQGLRAGLGLVRPVQRAARGAARRREGLAHDGRAARGREEVAGPTEAREEPGAGRLQGLPAARAGLVRRLVAHWAAGPGTEAPRWGGVKPPAGKLQASCRLMAQDRAKAEVAFEAKMAAGRRSKTPRIPTPG